MGSRTVTKPPIGQGPTVPASDPEAAVIPRKVLIVAPTPPPSGGMALQARFLERLLSSDGVDTAFFPSNFSFPRALQGMQRVAGLRTAARSTLIWLLLIRPVLQADVVHIFAASWLYFFVVVWPAVALGRLFGRRVILNYRGGDVDPFFRKFGWLARPVFRLASSVTTPSRFLSSRIHFSFGVDVAVIPNIINLPAFRFRRRSKFAPKLLVTRNLEKMYDVECVVRQIARSSALSLRPHLTIAGTGTQETQLRALIANLQLQNVRFLGQVAHPDLPAIYDQCDIFVNASRVDNFPGALLEASAAGLAIVSTNVGGIPYMYDNDVNALLVNPGDIDSLAAAVMRVLATPKLGERLTTSAIEIARSCEWDLVRKLLYNVYGFAPQQHTKQTQTAQVG